MIMNDLNDWLITQRCPHLLSSSGSINLLELLIEHRETLHLLDQQRRERGKSQVEDTHRAVDGKVVQSFHTFSRPATLQISTQELSKPHASGF